MSLWGIPDKPLTLAEEAAIAAAVVKGVAFLDKTEEGDWRAKVRRYPLNMGHNCHCVLGRLHFDYRDYLRLHFGDKGDAAAEHWAYAHGFNLPLGSTQEDWQYLNQAWRAVLGPPSALSPQGEAQL